MPLLKIPAFYSFFQIFKSLEKIKRRQESYLAEHDEVVIAMLVQAAGLERSGMRAELPKYGFKTHEA